MYKIGIPRGMLHYDYYPLWSEFFRELGAEVILSPKTNKEILDNGIFSCVDEACLPVKIFHGHVNYLKDKVDYLFIPKVISIRKKEYCCPKVLGLPDMVRFSIEDLPPIITTKINLFKFNNKYKKAMYETGYYLNKNTKEIRSAYRNAIRSYKRYVYLMNKGILPIEAIKMYNKAFKDFNYKLEDNKMSILVAGHAYNLYDDYLNMDVINKLIGKNINVLTPEMISDTKIIEYSNKLPKRMFWTHGRRIIGSSFNLIEEGRIDGIIYLSSFGCGMDSVLVDLIERKATVNKIPFTLLTLDEQTGEAGVNTRLEAFIDMIKWRYKNDINISTFR